MKSPKLTIPLSCYYDKIMNVLNVVLSCPVHGAREVWERVKAQAKVQVKPSREL